MKKAKTGYLSKRSVAGRSDKDTSFAASSHKSISAMQKHNKKLERKKYHKKNTELLNEYEDEIKKINEQRQEKLLVRKYPGLLRTQKLFPPSHGKTIDDFLDHNYLDQKFNMDNETNENENELSTKRSHLHGPLTKRSSMINAPQESLVRRRYDPQGRASMF